MKTTAAVLAFLAFAAAGARAQVFEGVPDLGEKLAAVRLQQDVTAVKIDESSSHRMGAGQADPLALAAGTPDIGAYPVRGMDISHYEDTVDWSQVKGQKLSFVYIKATDGTDIQDAQFSNNWKGATAAGLRKGAYHFYDFCEKGAPQAANLISVLPKEKGMLPPAIDLEMSVECKARQMPAKKAFLKQFAIFITTVEKHYGVKPILYLEDDIYVKYMEGVAEGYKIWFPDPHHAKPAIPNNLAWTFWQYSFKGRVAGVNGPVDLDVFNGDEPALAGLGGNSAAFIAGR